MRRQQNILHQFHFITGTVGLVNEVFNSTDIMSSNVNTYRDKHDSNKKAGERPPAKQHCSVILH